jgi:anaerobic ribonucleoside-triphosphate reductase activating protein
MNKQIRIAGVVKESIVDGPGIRFVVFAQGCRHNCAGCHNPETHDFNRGQWVDIDVIIDEMKKNPLLDGITLSGGEPFEQAEAFGELAEKSKNMGYDVMTYTGYTYETLLGNKEESWSKLLKRTDILVDGKFQIDQKSLLLKFKGSKNQRIIDVKKSLLLKNTVLREV